ncbi:MAG: hypothetical protein JW798_01275 [Prolixibacteraceae bacterium]|nr:hypothetical protein [Prolixibacteraceae bacterium]
MVNFLSKLFGKPEIIIPKKIKEVLVAKFPDIINVEWNKTADFFEAIFYKDQLEYIALISPDGELIEYKKFLPDGFLPQVIIDRLALKGEVMNAVMINKGNAISYEIIIRDSELIRYLYLFDETGSVTEMKKL